MIKMTVSEAYAYDFHSIAAVKRDKMPSAQSEQNWWRIDDDIVRQVGAEKHQLILGSTEYERLYAVNLRLYELVDLAKKDVVKASEVDQGVYDRWLAKKALQDKFFPSSQYQEQKFGYGKS